MGINKLVFKIMTFAIVYDLFMAASISPLEIYHQFASGESVTKTLLYVIPIFDIPILYNTTIILFTPLLYLTTAVFFLIFSLANFVSGNKLRHKVLLLGLYIKLKSKKNIFAKYIIFYSLTFSSFIIFIYNGLYIPVWLYENLFHTRAFFRVDEAVKYFFNFNMAIIYGSAGFLLFVVANELSRKIFSKQIDFDNFIGIKE